MAQSSCVWLLSAALLTISSAIPESAASPRAELVVPDESLAYHRPNATEPEASPLTEIVVPVESLASHRLTASEPEAHFVAEFVNNTAAPHRPKLGEPEVPEQRTLSAMNVTEPAVVSEAPQALPSVKLTEKNTVGFNSTATEDAQEEASTAFARPMPERAVVAAAISPHGEVMAEEGEDDSTVDVLTTLEATPATVVATAPEASKRLVRAEKQAAPTAQTTAAPELEDLHPLVLGWTEASVAVSSVGNATVVHRTPFQSAWNNLRTLLLAVCVTSMPFAAAAVSMSCWIRFENSKNRASTAKFPHPAGPSALGSAGGSQRSLATLAAALQGTRADHRVGT